MGRCAPNHRRLRMEELGVDGTLETQSTSDSEAEKILNPREGLECELEELRAMNRRQEQELLQLRKVLAYAGSRGSGDVVVPEGDESVAQLKHKLSSKDLLVTELEQSLSERQQDIADELSKRKEVQYKQIQSGRECCDLLEKCSEYQQQIIMLESENSALRQSAGQMPKAKPTMDAMHPHTPPTAKPGPGMFGEVRSPPKTKFDKGTTCSQSRGSSSLLQHVAHGMDESNTWVYDSGVWWGRAATMNLPVLPGTQRSTWWKA